MPWQYRALILIAILLWVLDAGWRELKSRYWRKK